MLWWYITHHQNSRRKIIITYFIVPSSPPRINDMKIYLFNKCNYFISDYLHIIHMYNVYNKCTYTLMLPLSCETSVIDDAGRKNDIRQMHVRLRERYWIIMKQIASSFIINDVIRKITMTIFKIWAPFCLIGLSLPLAI